MKNQRERTIALLQQKDAEVEAARNDAVELVASARERTLSRQGSVQRLVSLRFCKHYSQGFGSGEALPIWWVG